MVSRQARSSTLVALVVLSMTLVICIVLVAATDAQVGGGSGVGGGPSSRERLRAGERRERPVPKEKLSPGKRRERPVPRERGERPIPREGLSAGETGERPVPREKLSPGERRVKGALGKRPSPGERPSAEGSGWPAFARPTGPGEDRPPFSLFPPRRLRPGPLTAAPRNTPAKGPPHPIYRPAPPGLGTEGVAGVPPTRSTGTGSPEAINNGTAPESVQEALRSQTHQAFIHRCDAWAQEMQQWRLRWATKSPTSVLSSSEELRDALHVLQNYDSECLRRPQFLDDDLTSQVLSTMSAPVWASFASSGFLCAQEPGSGRAGFSPRVTAFSLRGLSRF